MKNLLSVITLCMLISVLASCGNNPQEEGIAQQGLKTELINAHFEENTYLSERIDLPSIGGFIQATVAHESRIYFARIETGSQNTLFLV